MNAKEINSNGIKKLYFDLILLLLTISDTIIKISGAVN